MEEMDGEEAVRRAWLRWLGVGTGSLALVLVALWTQRAPIAENFVSRELNRRGVQANYDLVDVGLRTQRIENIVLGDPARPDLTAKWVEVDLSFTGLTPQIAEVRAGGVRVRGALHDGILTLGELDRFRDPASTAPFSLPDLPVALTDARMTLDTDMGRVGMQIDGGGNLQSGFRGQVALATPKADISGCGVRRVSALLDIAMREGAPHFAGPFHAEALACGGAGMAFAKPAGTIDLALGKTLDRWTGHADLSGEAVKASGVVLARPSGRIDFDGTAARTAGTVKLAAEAARGRGAMLEQSELAGDWSVQGDETRLDGELDGRHLRFARADPLAALRTGAAGTPLGPLGARLADAVQRAGQANRLHGRFAFVQKGKVARLVVTDSGLDARSGARIGIAQGGRMTMSWPGRTSTIDWALDGAITADGGGLPRAALRLARRPGGGFGGQLFLDPYAAGNARLALDTVRFTAEPNGATRFATAVRLDGPLPDGYVRGLSLPLEGRIAPGGGAVAINSDCAPLSVLEARYGAFAIGQTRQTLCPVSSGPLIAYGAKGLSGGADMRGLDLSGRSGDSPMRLTADHARLALGRTGFSLDAPALTIGSAESPVRLSAATMDGAITDKGFSGTVDGAGGQIGAVPLIVERGSGNWRFADGTLGLRAAMTVRDSQAPARFKPLPVPDFDLTLKNGRISARGTLTAPRGGAAVAVTDILHDLGSGRGHADLRVRDLTFGGELQPEDLTPLTLGVVANVKGAVDGEGHIEWNGSAVTSSGTFRTQDMNLAAAFGPVEGLSTQIHFTDLINLITAPGQEAHIRSVNPGVEVRDGVIRYHLEAGQKVRVEGGGWPFSGGQLELLPTTMDFSADVDRYLTFRVLGLDAGAFIQAMELDNVSATGTFDGIMPLIFNAQGGRVAGGVLVARQAGMPMLELPEGVLPNIPCDPTKLGGTLSYVGPVSNEQLGTMGRMAFDALKDLQYKCLTILMDGALDGEMVTNVVFNGINRGQLGSAPAGLARNFVGLPFIFNVRIAAPFRGLLGTAQSLIDPSQIIQNSIGDQVQDKMRGEMTAAPQTGLAVQPVESDKAVEGDPK
ncbi:hypothetical protein J3E64_000504 [Sphingobium sp. OAS761]|uniref:intermembrane phospholipid transport protein YdbH family protein n=1 Tax=Sphingobium sp. OAS761 TaxID=2817901 RepID=UPI0020A1488D|nr:YdbH domain-containing protein [Sphingobium sp. OAS761]MCP1468837.1 hypothetical protein [Sphingobium sp. OAS761]